MVDAAPTAAELVAAGRLRLGEAGFPDARREALRIWSGITGQTSGAAFLGGESVACAEDTERFLRAVERRAAGEPLAYVVGSIGFRTLTVRTDSRALIPRPETEGLVGLALERVQGGRVADVGTGTGCIALSLAAEGDYESVVALDSEPAAVSLAAENAARCRLPVALVQGDLTAPLAPGSLDALVSNPPYLTDEEYAGLDRSVSAWEPRAALPSGADGLAATLRLLDDGRRVVRGGGWVALEVDSRRAAIVAAMAGELGWTEVVVAQDLFERERYVLARRRTES